MSKTVPAEVTFRFRARDGIKRPDVVVTYDVPTVDGLIAMLQGDDAQLKQVICEAVHNVQQGYVRTLVDADPDFNQEKLDAIKDKITLEAIAHLPQGERNVTSKEDLEAFARSYIKYMPAITGKSEESVKLAASVFVSRLKNVRGNRETLTVLNERLSQYLDKAPQEEVSEHEKALNYLASQLESALQETFTAEDL